LVKEFPEFERCIIDVGRISFEFDSPCAIGVALNIDAESAVFDERIPMICECISMHLCAGETVPAFPEEFHVPRL